MTVATDDLYTHVYDLDLFGTRTYSGTDHAEITLSRQAGIKHKVHNIVLDGNKFLRNLIFPFQLLLSSYIQ